MTITNRSHYGLVINDALRESFQIYSAQNFKLLSKFLANGNKAKFNTTADSKEFFWTEKHRERIESEVTTGTISGFFDTTPRDLVVDSTVKHRPDQLLRFENADKTRKSTLLLKITEVTDATTLKVIKLGGVDTALIATDRAVMMGNSLREGSTPGQANEIVTVSKKSNYFQIQDWIYDVSRSLEGSNVESNQGKLAEQRIDALYFIAKKYTEMYSSGVKSTSTEQDGTEVHTAGGIREFFGTPIDGGGVDITSTKLNDAIQQIVDGGGKPDTVRCSASQARKISALDANKIQINLSDKHRGNKVTTFQSDIPYEGGVIATIEVDYQMAPDEIEILSTDNIAIVHYSNGSLKVKDATTPGQDGYVERQLFEASVMVDNGTKTQAWINNLTY